MTGTRLNPLFASTLATASSFALVLVMIPLSALTAAGADLSRSPLARPRRCQD